MYLADKHAVATDAALNELLVGTKENAPITKYAGPIEKAILFVFLLGVERIPNDPSDRVKGLPSASEKQKKYFGAVDRNVFGTGDKLKIETLTGDGKFVEKAKTYNVYLDKVIVHPFGRYSGT
jgi:Protein of unknown function (DUF1308)